MKYSCHVVRANLQDIIQKNAKNTLDFAKQTGLDAGNLSRFLAGSRDAANLRGESIVKILNTYPHLTFDDLFRVKKSRDAS